MGWGGCPIEEDFGTRCFLWEIDFLDPPPSRGIQKDPGRPCLTKRRLLVDLQLSGSAVRLDVHFLPRRLHASEVVGGAGAAGYGRGMGVCAVERNFGRLVSRRGRKSA